MNIARNMLESREDKVKIRVNQLQQVFPKEGDFMSRLENKLCLQCMGENRARTFQILGTAKQDEKESKVETE